MQSGAGVRECGGGVEAKDTGSRIEALRDDDRENVIRLELVIRRDLSGREGVTVMNMNGNNAGGMPAAGYNEIAIVGEVVNGRINALSMEPRHIDVRSSKEDLDAIMEDAKRGMWSALEPYQER